MHDYASSTAVRSRLEALRRARHETRLDLARAIGISPAKVSDFEAGRRRPGREELDKLARYYGVSPQYLVRPDQPALAHPPGYTGPLTICPSCGALLCAEGQVVFLYPVAGITLDESLEFLRKPGVSIQYVSGDTGGALACTRCRWTIAA